MDSSSGKFNGSTAARGEAEQQHRDDKESRRTLQQRPAQEARGSNSGEQHSSGEFEGSPEVCPRELGPATRPLISREAGGDRMVPSR
ncbi:hypothetical protein CRG98_019967 [Punica granatum]|uniref:Uncharacterized protein n=1 Tax=Punica granatum TaxID=22663 RepID=A0A2I0JUQ7_PUNGR|nr:hypothetical protein CRG98_019967 [Punica granatum]